MMLIIQSMSQHSIHRLEDYLFITRGPTGSTLMAQMRHRPAEETRGHTSSSLLNPKQPRARKGSADTQQSPGTREAARAFARSGPAGSPCPGEWAPNGVSPLDAP